MAARGLFLLAYACSGMAGLIYEITWTRLMALQMGHTTAAASTVLAAFMGGLAAGSWAGGRIGSRLTPSQTLAAYAGLELLVILTALAIPFELSALVPLLKWTYADGAGLLFPLSRLVVCLAVVFVPAVALGATFPMAVRWYAASGAAASAGGRVYAANTTGAALGAIAAGFFLIPALGVWGTTLTGIAASAVSIGLALMLWRRTEPGHGKEPFAAAPVRETRPLRPKKAARQRVAAHAPEDRDHYGLAAAVLLLTGFATFVYEIAWTRAFAMVVGPSTYAFASTLAAFICGLAAGAVAGTWILTRVRHPALPLAFTLTAAAAAATWASAQTGGPLLGQTLAAVTAFDSPAAGLMSQWFSAALLVAPLAVALGAAFPMALALSLGPDADGSRLSVVYAVNTVGSVAGALSAGFLLVPRLGLERTIQLASVALLLPVCFIVARGLRSRGARVAAALAALATLALVLLAPPWDRELLASGLYKYARQVPAGADVETALRAGTILYYREGATGTVSVKRLTGDRSLAIDGKVDASTSGDMITQKLLAHLPLLLHPQPQTVSIIGLGSGVTAGAALVHPVAAVEVVEISPEVIEASSHFTAENRRALDDPRTRLIEGDGRSHMLLSSRQYDVIVSEPSNPWMAGVAALFTQEFFTILRDRLAPGGIVCQWAHTYDISTADLRSIVATFTSVFPGATMWLVGNGDLLLLGSLEPLGPRLDGIARAWVRPGVGDDLASVSLASPFSLWSLYAGGAAELAEYGAGAVIQSDDRMALEFSGPRALNLGSDENLSSLRALLSPARRPETIARAMNSATAADWRERATLMLKAGAYEAAYEDYARALELDATDAGALSGIVQAALASHRQSEARSLLARALHATPAAPAIGVALSRLHAITGDFDGAVRVASDAYEAAPTDPAPLEQLASLHADTGDAARLAPVVTELQQRFPERPASLYFAAALHFMRGDLPGARQLIDRTLQAAPAYAQAHNLRGAICAQQGDLATARTALQTALQLDPRDTSAYANLGLLELDSGNAATAGRWFAELLSLDPSSAAGRDGLARARAAGR